MSANYWRDEEDKRPPNVRDWYIGCALIGLMSGRTVSMSPAERAKFAKRQADEVMQVLKEEESAR